MLRDSVVSLKLVILDPQQEVKELKTQVGRMERKRADQPPNSACLLLLNTKQIQILILQQPVHRPLLTTLLIRHNLMRPLEVKDPYSKQTTITCLATIRKNCCEVE